MSDETPDARPVPVPPAVHELIRQVAPDPVPAASAEGRHFNVDGREWVARIVGEGVGGTGARGSAYLVAIGFYPVIAREQAGGEQTFDGEAASRAIGRGAPSREALLPQGRFEMLYDEELAQLFRTARRLPRPSRG